ncbi:MAG TPA: sigma-70 family RNA polymerase sigma factor [Cytophagaceae bacterium]
MSSNLQYHESDLLQRISEGDQSAFKELHNYYWSDLYHVALGFLKSPEWAQDIIQDVFLKIWERRNSLGHVQNFKSYLFVVTRNELITAINKDLRNENAILKYRRLLQEPFLLQDQPVELKELQTYINQGIAMLPEQQQVMLELARKEGLSHLQIAEKLDRWH